MIKSVVFDLDGTLIDSTEAIVESFMHTFDVLEQPRPPRDAVVKSIGFTLEQQFEKFTKTDPNECALIYRAYYDTVCREKTFLLPGAEESLRQFSEAGLTIGFASSKQRRFCEVILNHLGVLEYFTTRLGPDDITHPKPHPEAVLRSAEMLGVTSRELYFIGDTNFDVLAARAAGTRCLCVTTGYNTREELVALGPEAVFDSLNELTQYALAHLASPGPAAARCGSPE
ncbi:MAG: HAD family hydrolase, partial [Candidatus Hydrogenedentes bacterium]|nr:HAD family hydrolase [Candidatus Hydrogenedentota bacterium]